MVNEEGYEPQWIDSRYNETQEPPQCAYKLDHELGYSDDRASEHGDHEDGYGNTYPHPPPVSTARDDHNPRAITHYPTPWSLPPAPIPLARDSPPLEPTASRDRVGKPRTLVQR